MRSDFKFAVPVEREPLDFRAQRFFVLEHAVSVQQTERVACRWCENRIRCRARKQQFVITHGIEAAGHDKSGRVVGREARQVVAQVAIIIVLEQLGASLPRRRDEAGSVVVVNPDMTPGQVVTARVSGARVEHVGARAISVENIVFAALEIVAIAASEFFLLVIVERQHGAATLERLAPGRAAADQLTAGVFRDRREEIEIQAVILFGDDVHNTGNSIRTVNRRGAVFQDFDAFNSGKRDGVQVKCRNGTARTRWAGATAVNQGQRAVGTEATQRDCFSADAAILNECGRRGSRHLGRAGGDCCGLQQRANIGDAFASLSRGRHQASSRRLRRLQRPAQPQ